MPLSSPADREALHRRDIRIDGYRRADGLFDIEAQLVDTKSYAFANHDRGEIAPGTALHGMWLRLTVDEDLVITACEAATDFAPYAICPEVTPNFAALAGLKIGPGFNRAVQERVGGTRGCTHLREVLAQMATVAFQTLYGQRRRRPAAAPAGRSASQIGSCYAYAPDSPVVRRFWPEPTGGAAE